MQTRICTICKLPKPINQFGKKRANKNGLRPECKICHNKENFKWRKNNPKYNKIWCKNHSKRNKQNHITLWRLDNIKKSNKIITP